MPSLHSAHREPFAVYGFPMVGSQRSNRSFSEDRLFDRCPWPQLWDLGPTRLARSLWRTISNRQPWMWLGLPLAVRLRTADIPTGVFVDCTWQFQAGGMVKVFFSQAYFRDRQRRRAARRLSAAVKRRSCTARRTAIGVEE